MYFHIVQHAENTVRIQVNPNRPTSLVTFKEAEELHWDFA